MGNVFNSYKNLNRNSKLLIGVVGIGTSLIGMCIAPYLDVSEKKKLEQKQQKISNYEKYDKGEFVVRKS
eukprot:TRINITY_DN4715_c0_g1_i1.p1 TRINITY_DN4715_c0_g1~~TRINITY_DN4715_c0_g1_i1.p1  ORF type:complete len:69 (+),score=3.52 TRINITY_DN4715_c0_g1_i1:106-312(+)